jgi:D-alanine-D-alanine ligase
MVKLFGNIVIVTGIGDYTSEDTAAVFKCRDAVKDSLRSEGHAVESFEIHENILSFYPEKILSSLKDLAPGLVFNLFEGFCGNAGSEAKFAHMLETEKIPFTGNSSTALEICLDKHKTKEILKKKGIRTPTGLLIRDLKEARTKDLPFPVFVKPAFEDASVGVDNMSLCRNKDELFSALDKKLASFPSGLIVEEFVSGKEFNAAFLGNYPYENLGVSMMDYENFEDCPAYLNFSSKWKENTEEYKRLMPRVLDKKDICYRSDIVETSRRTAKALGLSNYFRVDLREKNGELYVLDVNPNPDISPDSGLVRQAASKDINYTQVVTRILESAYFPE